MKKEKEIKEKFKILNVIITLIVGGCIYFFLLPPLNLSSPAFWGFIIAILVVYALLEFVGKINSQGKVVGNIKLPSRIVIAIILIVIGILGLNFVLSPLFNSSSYAKRIDIDEDGDFYADIPLVNFKALPLLDKDSSRKLGDRVMGQMSELVSQFVVSDLYTQINYNDEIVRVTPLEYQDFIKYLTNRKNGVAGYILVDSVDGNAKLVKLDKGMKYMPSAFLFENLDRKLRFAYPTTIFGKMTFEIDNEGKPYWVVPTIKYEGIGLKKEVTGIIIFDPTNGKSKQYKTGKIPAWVDHVYDAELIIEQINNWGLYKGGYWNSLFGQKNVVATTEGYNYTIMNDDVYMYTGITSVVSDESNIGFVLCNLRTKETNYYKMPGAEEYSAMASAEGQVQQMRYTSTFPLLINLNNKATYLVSLKDAAGLVKMYGFIDVMNYQKVVVTDSAKGIEAAAEAYLGGVMIDVDESKLITKTITISTIANATISGNTYYYITDSEGKKYSVSISVDKKRLPFIVKGTKLEISYEKEQDVTDIIKIK